MPRFNIKVSNHDEGENLGVYESDYLPRVGDPFALWHPRVCPRKDEPFCAIVSGVTHETVSKEHPYGKTNPVNANVVETVVWLMEEYAAPVLFCDCTEEERVKYEVIDGTCENCNHPRHSS